MPDTNVPQVEQNIARCRVALSMVALAAVFIDPTEPLISQWFPLRSGTLTIDPYALGVMTAHLCYSLAVVYLVTVRTIASRRLVTITTWVDVLFGATIAAFTEGATSPFYVFFAFAVLETGLRAGLRRTLVVTGVSSALYVTLIAFSAHNEINVYIMRPVYLAITGYLVGYLGQQRLNLESGIRELAAANQRQQIARDLHDGRAQALAGIALRLETCQQLLHRGSAAETLFELSDLQASINREYDDLRAYMRSLVGLEPTGGLPGAAASTHFSVQVAFEGSGELVEHVFRVVREGVTNVRRHARARHAAIRAAGNDGAVRISLEDDGIGFLDGSEAPWSIASLVTELGGTVDVVRDRPTGAHLTVTLPAS